ncbi:MarR family winged helix-turn-helix transcriptional regulator [Marinivivus vitaminiproducens]|uniref:MarR family winged helix-turn-helix transcriptional regulator n=1 Tax=Marinivivus vitaminiproducens TaxID=3035935 RepID=UPI0027A0C7D6|nr:MarR family winged helix-turn-helix transcriptional regulator [Geminicoccaceae bacterium SCSIO 64248]
MTEGKIENVVGAMALALADAVLHDAQDHAPEPGLAAAAIVLLGHDPGMTIERLRRALLLSHPGAVRLVDRLVAEGAVVRQPRPDDRRAVALRLTEAGDRSSALILDARRTRLARALAALEPGERRTLGRLAEKLLASFIRDVDHAYATCRLCDSASCPDCPVDAALSARA